MNHPASKIIEDQGPISSPENVMTLDQAMASHIRQMLKVAGGRIHEKGGAAELLNMKESTLGFRMNKLGIKRVKTVSVQ